MQYNIPDVRPAAVISAFHQNVRNRKMRDGQASDLHIIPQKEGENLRKYI